MFGRNRRKAQAAELATEVTLDAAPPVVDASPLQQVESFTRAQVSLDESFLAMMAQLDDSLAAMARACDRIEDAVAGASRQRAYADDASAA